MSTSPVQKPEPVLPVPAPEHEIRVYSHSGLFYWWPVWACGFVMCLVTWLGNSSMAVLPRGAQSVENANHKTIAAVPKGTGLGTQDGKTVLILPSDLNSSVTLNPDTRFRMMASQRGVGVIFAAVLLAIIFVTNVASRGLWSVLLLLVVFVGILTLVLVGWWNTLVDKFSEIDIRISFAGYLAISLVLFTMWALTIFVFDRRTYVAISSGQLRICTAIGTGETVYDTAGMTFQKRQDDLFRHWIVGLGSGDLVLHRTNVNREIDFPNVLFIGGKIRQIEKLVKEKEVV